MKKYLKEFGIALMREAAKHFWLWISLLALVLGHYGMALGWLVMAFYFKLSDVADRLETQHARIDFQIRPIIKPMIDTGSAKPVEEHF